MDNFFFVDDVVSTSIPVPALWDIDSGQQHIKKKAVYTWGEFLPVEWTQIEHSLPITGLNCLSPGS